MAVREIVVIEHPVLRRKAKKIVKLTAEHRKLIEDMIETMRAAPGVGLAAPQVAVGERLIVIEWADEPETEEAPPPKKKLYVVLNPEIVWASEEMVEGTEGCLSVPGWVGNVLRHEAVTVRGLNRNGEKIKIDVEGWLARIFQHEIDHLDGVLYIDKLVSPETLRQVQAGTEEADDLKAEAIG
ncbi:Peptide deformylase [Thermoflexales bacterium]|nr:Peptide deformylase [Thermoflexales bacterium]